MFLGNDFDGNFDSLGKERQADILHTYHVSLSTSSPRSGAGELAEDKGERSTLQDRTLMSVSEAIYSIGT